MHLACVPYLEARRMDQGGAYPNALANVFRVLTLRDEVKRAVEIATVSAWQIHTLGSDKVYWISDANSIAWTMKDHGADALAEAEHLARWAVDTCGGQAEPDEWLLAGTADTLSVILVMRGGDLDEAEALARDAVESSVASFGEGDALTAECRLHLGQCLLERGELDAARGEFELAGAAIQNLEPAQIDLAAEMDAALARLATLDR